MTHNSSFFERLIKFAQSQGIMNANQLAKHLGYGSSEKISRLGRGNNTKPGFDLLLDLANMFENVPLFWLITGRTEKELVDLTPSNNDNLEVNEPHGAYTRLPSQYPGKPNASTEDQGTNDINSLFQDLLGEKDEVIATLKEVIEAQKDTISLLKQKLD